VKGRLRAVSRTKLKQLAFPKSRRLTSNRQFKAVLDHGRRAGDGLLTLWTAPNDCGHPRLGISVGKSYGKAVVRNRLKRLLREAFRRSQDRIPQDFDYVLMMSASLLRKLKRTDGGEGILASLTLGQVQESLLSAVGALFGDRADRENRTDG
jgi:ribonuclease P protein component